MTKQRCSIFFFNSQHLLLIAVAVAIFSCGMGDGATQNEKTVSATPGTAVQDYLVIIGDSVLVPAFAVEAKLSSPADSKLQEARETLIVTAWFSGIPKDTSSKEFREWGEIFIKSHSIELDTGHIARFEGMKFPKALYDSLAGKDIRVLVNIYSGRRSTPDNLLDCEILSEKMSVVKGRTMQLSGKLISEADSLQ
jgi:hypothetical protein